MTHRRHMSGLVRLHMAVAASLVTLTASGCDDALVGAECREGSPCGPLELVRVYSPVMAVRAGQVGVEVVGTVRNRSTTDVQGASLRLTFTGSQGDDRDADFVAWQAEAWSTDVGVGDTIDVAFRVDVAPAAIAEGTVTVDGDLAYSDSRLGFVEHARDPWVWTFVPMNPDLVVNTLDDSDDGDDSSAILSLRRALRLANDTAGMDRIVFAADVFPPNRDNIIVLRSDLPDLPTLHGDIDPVLVVAVDDRVTLSPDVGFNGTRRVAVTAYGPAAIHGLRWLEMSRLVEATPDCVDSPAPGVGSALCLAGGEQVLVSNNHFVDTGMAERPCTAALVAATGGSSHLIVGNLFEDSPNDSISVLAAPTTVRGNRIIRGLDDGIVVDTDAGGVRVEGNLVVESVLAGLMVYENSDVEVVNNTFVRNACHGVQALAPVRLWLRNNAYIEVVGSAIAVSLHGTNVDAAYEATDSTIYCYDCSLAEIEPANMYVDVHVAVADAAGSSWEAMTPTATSLLANSGVDVGDRNGSIAGRFDGSRPERGAVERAR